MASRERVQDFRNRLSAARTQKAINGWLAVGWLAFGLMGVWTDLKDSIPVLFFISVYANTAGHWAAWEAAKSEVRQEQETT